jgi:hypothetical protein
MAIELTGVESNRDAVGAVVVVESGDLRQMRQVTAGSSYASQSSQRLYFGLDEQERVDRVLVRWPSGGTDELLEVPSRSLIRLREGGEPLITSLPGVDPETPSAPAG